MMLNFGKGNQCAEIHDVGKKNPFHSWKSLEIHQQAGLFYSPLQFTEEICPTC